MNLVHLAAMTLFLVSCSSGLPAQRQTSAHIQQRGDGYLLSFADSAESQGLTLKQFLEEVECAAPFRFSYTQETAMALASKRVKLTCSKTVPEGQFDSFLQVLLVMNDFITTELESNVGTHFLVETMPGFRPGNNVRLRSGNPRVRTGN